MTDVYNILSKHFFKEASSEEEKIVRNFRNENPAAYRELKELWDLQHFFLTFRKIPEQHQVNKS